MKIFSNFEELNKFLQLDSSIKGNHLTIGGFDGIHSGHHVILNSLPVKRVKNERNIVITFEKPPKAVLYPEHFAGLLLSLEDKIKLLSNYPIDILLLIPFDKKFAQITYDDFLTNYLEKICRPISINVGINFRFGFKQQGTPFLMQNYFKSKDVNVIVHKAIVNGKLEETISSSLIRNDIRQGNIKRANTFLNRAFHIKGRVRSGEKRGKAIGYPTANIEPIEKMLTIPKEAVYAGISVI
ncbi:riboflavin kinase, partial [Candidatus Riflebacteria bacterium]